MKINKDNMTLSLISCIMLGLISIAVPLPTWFLVFCGICMGLALPIIERE